MLEPEEVEGQQIMLSRLLDRTYLRLLLLHLAPHLGP